MFGLVYTYSARGQAGRGVVLGTGLIGAVVFGWLGLHSAPSHPADIQDAYDGPMRMLFGLIFGFVIGGVVGFGGVIAGLVVCDSRLGRWFSWELRNLRKRHRLM